MKIRFLHYAVLLSSLLTSSIVTAQDCQDNWLSVQGNKIVDINGTEVKLAGVNWSGFETSSIHVLEGLYNRDILSMLTQIKELGFNHIRVPWHNGIVRQGSDALNVASSVSDWTNIQLEADPYYPWDDYFPNGIPSTYYGPWSNLDLQPENGILHPLDVLDYLVEWCQDNDMRIVLDNHSREPGGYAEEELWYTDSVPHEQWIQDWVFMAERYKDYSAVMAMDLNNEPHGNPEDYDSYATWGTGDIERDWRMAAEDCGNAILQVNPNVLIMVEGIEQYITPEGEETNYWWGGNLQGARDFPVRLNDMSKLVYSPHEYGPTVYSQDWFFTSDFPDNMEGIWESNFNFINSTGIDNGSGTVSKFPLYVGELGIKNLDSELDVIWYETFTKYIKDQNLHWSYWVFNPNSGDTGGILSGDWLTVEEWKMDYLEPILSDPIPNCIVYTGINLSSEEFNAEVVDFKVYPNPTTNIIKFATSSGNLKSVKLYDMMGKQIQPSSTVASDALYEFDIENQAAGIYLAKVVSKKGIAITIKVIKK